MMLSNEQGKDKELEGIDKERIPNSFALPM